MPDLIGADVEQLRALASSFEEKAQAVRSIERRVSSACGELGRFWHGADAADYVSRWQSNHRPRLLSVATGLVDASKLLTTNAEEQDHTSSIDGAGLGGFTGSATGSVSGLGAGLGVSGSFGGGGGGGRFGFGFGVPILGDGWDVVSEFASDTWDGVTDTVDAAVDETGHRLSEFGQYGGAYADRWFDNPIQSVFDELTLTGPFERLVGSGSILLLGGEYQENVRPGEAEFITGLPFEINDAITLGHSVLVDDPQPRGGLLEHELQHVDDIEAVGGIGFYSTYLGNWIGNIIVGQDPSVGGEAYENIWWEQRADAAQRGNPPIDLDFGRFDPRNWFD